jgi:hypothetical protein
VPNTLTEVTIAVAISTDFPAEQSVASTPPDSIPSWFNSDAGMIGPTDSIGFRFTKNVVRVIFTDSSTLVDRQLAVALVNGKLIGGEPVDRGSGAYYLWVADDGTGSQLWSITRRLSALPQVRLAMPVIALSEM